MTAKLKDWIRSWEIGFRLNWESSCDSPGELLVVHETAAVTDQVPELGQLQPPPEAPGDPGLVVDLGLPGQ